MLVLLLAVLAFAGRVASQLVEVGAQSEQVQYSPCHPVTPLFDCSLPCTQSCGACPTNTCWATCVSQCIQPETTQKTISDCEAQCQKGRVECRDKCTEVTKSHQHAIDNPSGDVCNHPQTALFSCRRPCHDLCSNCISPKECQSECFMKCEYPKQCMKICDNNIQDCHGECVKLSKPVEHSSESDSDSEA